MSLGSSIFGGVFSSKVAGRVNLSEFDRFTKEYFINATEQKAREIIGFRDCLLEALKSLSQEKGLPKDLIENLCWLQDYICELDKFECGCCCEFISRRLSEIDNQDCHAYFECFIESLKRYLDCTETDVKYGRLLLKYGKQKVN